MTFKQACKEKFEKGHQEHNQPWDLEHINHVAEIQDELVDIYHYASLEPDNDTMRYLMIFAEKTWENLEKKKPVDNVCITCES